MFHYSVSIGTGVSVLSPAFSVSLAVVTGVCVLLSGTGVPALTTALERSSDFFLISQPKHMLWVLKRTVSMRRSFQHP